jgi:DNA-binding transcriptional regulator GbsR (MarR family)
MPPTKNLEEKIYSTFSEVASSIGYSPLHGRIIGVLLVKGRALSLKELAKETGYSTSMISLSLDLLEVLGVIKKVKKTADRQLYITLQGDLLEILKNAIVTKVTKSVSNTLADFQESRADLKSLPSEQRKETERTLDVLEKEIKRLDRYIRLLEKMRLP